MNVASRTRASARAAATALVLAGVFGFAPAVEAQPPWARNKAYPDGQVVVVTGTVTDATGQPIPRVDLVFEASRRTFNVRKLRDVTEPPRVVTGQTDDAGQYSLEWRWHQYFNDFRLAVVVPIGTPGGQVREEVLVEIDLSDRIREGTPVVVPITVDDTTRLHEVREFMARLDSPDEQRIYQQEGQPDRIDQFARTDADEETWWYFDSGTLYRFRDGALGEVENFEPVRGFEG